MTAFADDIQAVGSYRYSVGQYSSIIARERETKELLKAVSLDGKSVVDVGCGDGTHTVEYAWRTHATLIIGIDPCQAAIQRAKEKCDDDIIRFKHASAADLVAQGLRYDVAIYSGVLHHTADPAAEIATALKLADTVYIDEPNGWCPALKILERTSRYHIEHGERSFTIGTLKRWIRDAGGEVLKVKFYGLVPYFVPDWFAEVCLLLQPIAELPLIRRFACGHVGILCRRRA